MQPSTLASLNLNQKRLPCWCICIVWHYVWPVGGGTRGLGHAPPCPPPPWSPPTTPLLLLIIDDEDQLAGYTMHCATLSMASGWGGEGGPKHTYRSTQQLCNLIAVLKHMIHAFPCHHPHHNLEWFDWDAVSSGSLVTPIATPIPDTAPSAPVGTAIYFLTFLIAFIV